MSVKIQNKNTSVQDQQIQPAQIGYGEIAINFNEHGPFVQVKDSNNEVIRVGGIIQNDVQPPGQKGGIWYRPSSKKLYLHDGTAWQSISGSGGGGGGDFSGDYNDLINKPTIGDGEINIQQDGVSVGTFTVNQTGLTTIDLVGGGGPGGIQVGDNVSLLTNDAGYITDTYVGEGQISIFTTDGPVASFNVNQNADQTITIPTGGGTPQVKSDWNATSGVEEILNKPDLSLKADLVGGVVPSSQLPAIAISTFLGSVASEAAMLALVGQTGDYCIRTDLSSTWLISGPDGTSIGNWTELITPPSPVESVNGEVGVVVLSASDVGALAAGDNISELINDAGYITNADIPSSPVLSVNSETGNVVLDASDVGAATAAQGSTADSALQPSDNISELANDAGYITSADVPTPPAQVQSDYTQADTAAVDFIKNKPDLTALATALQPGDNVSELTNDSDYLVKGSINPVLYALLADLPAAADNHGGVAHVHETGLEYYAHAGNWIALAKASDIYWQQAAGVLSPITATDVINAAGYRIDQLTTLP